MKYKRITKEKAIEFLKNSKNGMEGVWFKTNGNTDKTGKRIDTIEINGKAIEVYSHTDAGKCNFRFDDNGNKINIYGYEECKVAYVLVSDYEKIFG